MFTNLFKKVFGTANDRFIKSLRSLVSQINALEPELEKLSDVELKARTAWLKGRSKAGESLDAILPDAFATVREAAKRTLGLRHFDVQLIGGMILHRGMIIEMATGEGKTLIATLAAYLNALTEKGVHVVTVNDYLARRDAEWMGTIYRFLGLSVGYIIHGLDDDERREAYAADITYATNNELGFDYLRDNMKFRVEDMVLRPFHFGIVDEVDSILIDEARTPLIISGPTEDSSELYRAVDQLIPQLTEEDYEKEEKHKSVTLTEAGSRKIENMLEAAGLLKGGSLYDIHNISLVHHANQALKAHKIFQRDVDYMIKDGQVMIVDEFTGRVMEGRRYSDGLHQALEAKEGVDIQMENQTLASITYQNLFRLYPKLSGMTGTAKTEEAEFSEIYKLQVITVPTNKPITRKDMDDEVYRTAKEKYEAIIRLIQECRERKQPILVGTVSIEKSELLSAFLKQKGIPHEVLNARYHEREAQIIAQAGSPGAVTIATNMAGRGTDIKLGGNADMRIEIELAGITDPKERASKETRLREEVKAAEALVKSAGGLFVIGTERHESRRIDNQLRGRSGRQGDPGASKFFLSLEDDLMRIFGSNRLDSMLVKLGLQEGEAIIHPWINKALERAQQKVEAHNFEIRKHLLRFDDVMNDQRKVIYGQRKEVMILDDVSDMIEDMRQDVLGGVMIRYIPERAYVDQWDTKGLREEVMRIFNMDLPIQEWASEEGIADLEIRTRLETALREKMLVKEKQYGQELMRMAEKSILLRLLDQTWKDHLHSLDHLRQGINLRAYAQRDPLNEYKAEAFTLFHEMMGRVREMVIGTLAHLEIYQETPEEISNAAFGDVEEQPQNLQYFDAKGSPEEKKEETLKSSQKRGKKGVSERLASSRKSRRGGKSSHEAAEELVQIQESSDFEGDIALRAGVGEVSRNALCSCGSGKRFKHCCGAEK